MIESGRHYKNIHIKKNKKQSCSCVMSSLHLFNQDHQDDNLLLYKICWMQNGQSGCKVVLLNHFDPSLVFMQPTCIFVQFV